MRLKSVYIGRYKNIKELTLSFDGSSFIDVFVGKNGSGKSNLFEAIIEIFRHLFEGSEISFEYSLQYEIDGQIIDVEWKNGKRAINGKEQKTLGKTPLPDNVLIYYSGHNDTIAELVERYEDAFKGRIKTVTAGISRRFLGIDGEYKDLLLSVLLLQSENNKARQFICQKLGIQEIGAEANLLLKRPDFADKKLEIDNFDIETHYWGAKGIVREFLDKLLTCIKGEFNHANIYNKEADFYKLPINIELFNRKFEGEQPADVFRKLDNLKLLNMLAGIAISLTLKDGTSAKSTHFSDGQFQSVYIYSIIELFKDRNCITLLDEPDAFLHPEWQFDFLKQVFEITDTTAKNNHVLMSSHSAVTLIPHDKKKIKFFDIKDNHTNCYDLPKAIAINKLSSALIRYSEQEQLLSIINAIQIEKKPVLFTEGSTDPIIIKESWYKLYDEDMPFIPFYAFSCTYIKQLLTDNRIHAEMGGLPVFALFDFDKAYDQWNGLNGELIENDPFKGKIKKWAEGDSFAIMLPVAVNADIQKQVIKNAATKETYGGNSCCEIEHLFYGQVTTAEYFQEESCPGGTQIVFKADSDKTIFAKEVIHLLDPSCFEPLRAVFDFIKSKCEVARLGRIQQ